MRVKDAVAECLTEMQGQFLSGQALAEKLHVSRTAVWKAICRLQEEGFPIEARKKVGYRLVQDADLLTEDTVQRYLRSRVLGQNLYVYSEVDSTNSVCKKLVREGAVHGTTVVANGQTAGRGRQGRTFVSPPGTGLYFSVILREIVSLQDASLLTACAAVAVARAIDAICGTQMQIKWVNDLYLHGRKCCGILTEGGVSLESGKMEYAIVGIGINVRSVEKFLPEELKRTATSLEEAVPGLQVRRAQLLAAVLYELERALRELPTRRFLAEYRSRSFLPGKVVEVHRDDGTVQHVMVLEITDDCGLSVRDTYGNVETLRAGEVQLKV